MPTYIYAQNLDNYSPDHLYIGKKEIPYDSEYPPGSERTSFINELAERKTSFKRIKSSDNLNIYYSENQYLIEMLTSERDSSGRTGMILFSGNLDTLIDKPNTLIQELNDFIKEIGWKINSSEIQETIDNAYFLFKRRIYRKKNTIILLSIMIGISMVLITIYLIK